MSCQYITAPEAARYLSVHKQTIWIWCKQGKLPYVRVGDRYRFCVDELNRFLKERGIERHDEN